MGIFGWSYPAGCSGPPDEYEMSEPWEHQPRCEQCSSFLPTKPQTVVTHEIEYTDYEETDWMVFKEIIRKDYEVSGCWVCKRCGHLSIIWEE